MTFSSSSDEAEHASYYITYLDDKDKTFCSFDDTDIQLIIVELELSYNVTKIIVKNT